MCTAAASLLCRGRWHVSDAVLVTELAKGLLCSQLTTKQFLAQHNEFFFALEEAPCVSHLAL